MSAENGLISSDLNCNLSTLNAAGILVSRLYSPLYYLICVESMRECMQCVLSCKAIPHSSHRMHVLRQRMDLDFSSFELIVAVDLHHTIL